MTSMLEGQEGLEWERSPMLRYFKRKFPVSISRKPERIEFSDQGRSNLLQLKHVFTPRKPFLRLR